MDSSIWTSAPNSPPVNTFWPGRFLKHNTSTSSVEFSTAGTEGSWLPFGSGANLCPGRQFAKIHCILTLAMMVDAFDCDILASPVSLKLDLKKFGMGVLGPKGRVPARVRRREW
jgi:cytochrome P450